MKTNPRELKNLEAQHEHGGSVSLGVNTLAIDYGTKFTGVAFADSSGAMIPLGVYDTDESLESHIQQLIEAKEIKLLIFGLPLGQDGSENPLCKLIKKFAQKFASTSLQIDYVNEKYSSALTIGKEGERIDDLAALQILEFYGAKNSNIPKN